MYLKINENGYILGHMSNESEGYNIEIPSKHLITFVSEKEWTYKYKYVNGELVELTEQEILSQPHRLFYAKEQAILRALERVEFGKRVIAMVGAMLEEKNLSVEQTAQINGLFATITTLLQTGSIQTAKAAIQSITPDEVITSNDIAEVIAEIDKFLGL